MEGKERNNKSYRENADFANEAVMKLLKVGIVAVVPRASASILQLWF